MDTAEYVFIAGFLAVVVGLPLTLLLISKASGILGKSQPHTLRTTPSSSEESTSPIARPGMRTPVEIYVAGATHRNLDGSSRQEQLLLCPDGQDLNLVAEPDNKYDPNAIKICRTDGRQMGYVPKHATAMIHKAWADGLRVEAAFSHSVPYKEGRKAYLGGRVNVWIQRKPRKKSKAISEK